MYVEAPYIKISKSDLPLFHINILVSSVKNMCFGRSGELWVELVLGGLTY